MSSGEERPWEISEPIDKSKIIMHIVCIKGLKMNAIRGIFDGEKFIPVDKFSMKKKCKVIITFLEEIDEDEDFRNFSAQTDGFSFWGDEREDIYQDYLRTQPQ